MQPELYWIELTGRGRLAIGPRPRGGDWLVDEMQALAAAGVGVLVCLLTDDETHELDLAAEAGRCGNAGLEFISFPIRDLSIPDSMQETHLLARRMATALHQDRSIAIHCRAGIGRSSLVAACVLVATGESPDRAFERIAAARGYTVPETLEQRAWVAAFAEAGSNS